MHFPPRRAFTLIELLVVIAIIAILAVVVILTLNPIELLRQSRDSSRLSDMSTMADALNIYSTDQSGSSGFSMGSASTTYISPYDPTATSTNQCTGLGMPALTAGQTYQCSSSSTYRSTNGSGWIPVNFSKISSGSPIGSLPADPTDQTSSNLYYTYATNGTQYEVTTILESQKYKTLYASNPPILGYPEVLAEGSSYSVSNLFNPSGLVGWWPMDEGSGSSTKDLSGNGNTGAWSGTPAGNNSTYYTGGKVGTYAGYFNGGNDYVNLGTVTSLPIGSSSRTMLAWIDPSSYNSSIGDVISWGAQATSQLSAVEVNASGDLMFGLYSGDCISSSIIPLNQWSFAVATYDGSNDRVYMNGVLVDTCSDTVRNTASSAAYIGNRIGITTNAFPGLIDDVHIYNRALSPAEIQALYNAEH